MAAFDFTGKRVLVTGASHGIGYAVARAFAAAGAELVILSSTASIHDAGARIEAESGRGVRALVCDISDRAAVKRAVGALDEFADLQKVPAFGVHQRLVGGAVELMALVDDVPVKIDTGGADEIT